MLDLTKVTADLADLDAQAASALAAKDVTISARDATITSQGTQIATLTQQLAAAQQPVTPPVVIPPVVTPPTPPPVIVGPPAGMTTLLHEDFTGYTSQADFLARFGRDPGKHLELSSPVTGDVELVTIGGVPQMALNFVPGKPTPTFSPRFNPPPAYSKLVIEWWDRYSPNFNLLAQYKAFLAKLGLTVGSAGLPQIGVYLNPGGVVMFDITDRVHNINTGSPLNPGPASPTNPNTTIQSYRLPSGWQGVDHKWRIEADGLGSMLAAFRLFLDGQLIIGKPSAPLIGPFSPNTPFSGPGQLLILEPGSNRNTPLPTVQDSRWISLIEVSTA